MKKYSIINILLLFYLFGCDNSIDNNENSNANQFLPLKTGNYWIYEYYEYDIADKRVSDTYIDSFVVKNRSIYNGKSAYEITIYRNSVYFDTFYVNFENNSIFINYNFKYDSITFAKKSEIWLKLAWFDNSKYYFQHIFDTIVQIKQFWFNQEFFGTREVTINNYFEKNYFANYFNLERNAVKHKISYNVNNSLKFIVNNDTTKLIYTPKKQEYITFVNSVGIYEWFLEPSSYYISNLNGNYFIEFSNGWRRKLLRYKIN